MHRTTPPNRKVARTNGARATQQDLLSPQLSGNERDQGAAFGPRGALLPLPLFALRLRTILLTVHKDRLPYPAGKEKACSRFHVGNRLLARHKWRGGGIAQRVLNPFAHAATSNTFRDRHIIVARMQQGASELPAHLPIEDLTWDRFAFIRGGSRKQEVVRRPTVEPLRVLPSRRSLPVIENEIGI